MKKIIVMFFCLALVFSIVGCGGKSNVTNDSISFETLDFTEISQIDVNNLHNGISVTISNKDEIDSIISFIQGIEGDNAESGKGYSEGTYDVIMYAGNEIIYSVGFGDSDCFYYGKGNDGYPVRYSLRRITINNDVIPFFERFFEE